MTHLTSDLIVIAGGASRRMGVAKAILPVPPDGTALVRHVIERLSGLVTGQTFVIANDPSLATKAGLPSSVRLIPDDYPGAGALGGLATGLARCSGWAIAVACDLPLVNPRLFEELIKGTGAAADDAWDAVVPRTEGYPQPLHALYHRRCLPAMQATLAVNNLRIISFYETVRVRYVDEPILRQVDPELRSFVNVNTPAEWARALALLES